MRLADTYVMNSSITGSTQQNLLNRSS